jgi:succinyl-diaminopimelate desuccinylase
MYSRKQALMARVDDDRELLIAFLRDFIRCPSPNPPGDTRRAAEHVLKLLQSRGAEHRVIAPNELMPNIVASFEGGKPGRHLALNGHIDVFPPGDGRSWTKDPWDAEMSEGKIYGRGACDMKSGTTASIFTYLYLREIRDELHGRLTLSAVSDEETFGPWGTRYLFEQHPEIIGDCCLNGEPTSLDTFRFGEKGPLWLRFTVRTHGAHGAYKHRSASATAIAARLISELETIESMPVPEPGNLAAVLDAANEIVDRAWGTGAALNLRRVTVNPGIVRGGVKVNMVAAECVFEIDFRLPNGLEDRHVRAKVDEILTSYPEASYETLVYNPPSWSPPDTEMADYIRANAHAISGVEPMPVVSLGGTDARLWRYRNIPAIVYGPSPIEMGGVDESVGVEEFISIVKTHVASAYDYMSRES